MVDKYAVVTIHLRKAPMLLTQYTLHNEVTSKMKQKGSEVAFFVKWLIIC